MPYFPERLAEVPGLADRYRALEPAAAREVEKNLWPRGLSGPELLAYWQRISVLDFIDLSPVIGPEGARLLASIGVPPKGEVLISYGDGHSTVLSIDWSTFLEYWDDFYYPGDDVRIATAGDLAWIVEINHEEELRVIQRPDQPGTRLRGV